MAIEKSLVSNPLDVDSEEAVEVNIVNPEAVSIETPEGGVIFDFDPNASMMGAEEHGANLAEYIEPDVLDAIGADLVGMYNADKESRSDWEESYVRGLDLLGLRFEDRTMPWAGACGVFHPMLSEAVVRFQAQTIQEIFPASGPAKTSIVGKLTDDKVKQAHRVQDYLNYLMTERMSEYRSETEKLLFSLPIAGSAFRKVYYDPNLGRPCSMFVPAEDFVVSYGASDLKTCERATHVMKKTPNEIRKLQVSGFYRDIDLPTPSPDIGQIQEEYNKLTGSSINYEVDQRHTLLEMVVDYDLPGFEDMQGGEETGIALPYVITIDKGSRKVLSIKRNWNEEDPQKLKVEHFVHYTYLPGLGFYGFGLVHMIGGLSKSATSLLRQLVDSGTLANLPGGLKARGLKIKGDDTPIMPGEFRDVDVPGGTIRDNISFMPYKEPSNVLYQLLGDIVQEGRRFASSADVKASDMNSEAPVGTTLAILEREMKVLSAVQARVHHAMGVELKILSRIVRDYGPMRYPYDDSEEPLMAQDFDDRVDIIPVSDPNSGTMAQRIMQYQAALQLSATAPQMYDLPLLHRQMIEVLGIRDADNIIPTDKDLKPTDPVSENMNIINGEPVKAFIYQDHEAHIQTHMSAMEDPKLLKILAMAPDAQVKQAQMMAHISEHVAFSYRQQIEKELGVELPPPDEPLPEDIELRLSKLVAPAAAQLTGKDKREMEAQRIQEQMQDPLIQLQQAELQLKAKQAQDKVQTDMAKIQADLEKSREKTELERDKLSQEAKVEGAKLGVRIAEDASREDIEKTRMKSKDMLEGVKVGVDIAKELSGE
jgi:hypothetical protein